MNALDISRLLRLPALWIAACVFAACATTPEEFSGEAPDLDGSSWRLEAMDGAAPIAGSEPTIEFSSGNAVGSTGANRYTVVYQRDAERLSFVPGVATTRTVREAAPGIMEQERSFLDWIDAIDNVAMDGERLVLRVGSRDALVFAPVR